MRITLEGTQAIEALAELEPLHNPASRDGLHAVKQALSGVPEVAVFAMACDATRSEACRTSSVPPPWRREWGVRRYGFHGLSHADCATPAAAMLGHQARCLSRVHLENSAIGPGRRSEGSGGRMVALSRERSGGRSSRLRTTMPMELAGGPP
jgi:acetate kinase